MAASQARMDEGTVQAGCQHGKDSGHPAKYEVQL